MFFSERSGFVKINRSQVAQLLLCPVGCEERMLSTDQRGTISEEQNNNKRQNERQRIK